MTKLSLFAICLGLLTFTAAHAARSDGKAPDQSPLNNGATHVERKLLNGDGEGKPGPAPADNEEDDRGNHRCQDEEDCERSE